ncbi:MAG: hypothetical protein K0M54_10105 [Pseudomonas sp.]|uniref:hypothetical protein n=1 Tax=unclassified Pseudomonas TaxID=196821 RepID=UPI0022345DB8|nr:MULTISPECIES: hypothetical protein [unclassified Pseudomonas]MBW8354177.1 hypothetical protein [Pseudomonas sp.]UZE32921.1 hypothetical protein LOY69_19570 [Pseudomonas sp. B21-059]
MAEPAHTCMHRLPLTFFQLLDLHLSNLTLEHPCRFGLLAFSPAEFAAKGYELIGEPTDFHFYEKSHLTDYHQRTLEVIFKCYFFGQQRIDSGFNLVCGVRLTTLLKYLKGWTKPGHSLAFYFSHDKKEGAVILDDRHVMRFNQWSARGAYLIATLESDFDSSNPSGRMATESVKKTFEHYSLALILRDTRNTKQPAAFRRLAREMNDAII